MKRLLNVLLLLAMAMAASAQISWNVRGGVGMAFPGVEQKSKAGVAAKIGVGCEIPLSSNISFMPAAGLEYMEAEYITLVKNYAYSYIAQTSSVSEYYTIKDLHRSRVITSLQFGYRLPIGTNCGLVAKLGPYAGIAFERLLEEAETFDAGIDVGVDFEYKRFVVGVNLEYSFVKTEFHDYDYGDIIKDKYTNRAAFLNFGYRF